MSAMGQAVTVTGVATRPWYERAADDPSEYYKIAQDLGLNARFELYLYKEAQELGPPDASEEPGPNWPSKRGPAIPLYPQRDRKSMIRLVREAASSHQSRGIVSVVWIPLFRVEAPNVMAAGSSINRNSHVVALGVGKSRFCAADLARTQP
jgi:hypothetical protein